MHKGWLEFLNDFENSHNITSRFHGLYNDTSQESIMGRHLLGGKLDEGVIENSRADQDVELINLVRFFYGKVFEDLRYS